MTNDANPVAAIKAPPRRAGCLVLLLALLAHPACAQNPAVVQTKGFSITIPGEFHVETDHKGTILAGMKGETPPFIVIYYADPPTSGDSSGMREFDRFRQSSIADVMGEGAKKMIWSALCRRSSPNHGHDLRR